MRGIQNIERKFSAALLAGAAVAVLAAVPFTSSFAADTDNPPAPPMMGAPRENMAHQADKDKHIDDMVTAGKLTSEQGEKLKAALKEFSAKQRSERKAFFDSLPNKTGISESTLKEVFRPRHGRGHDNPKAAMDKLVEQGKITQQEAEALNAFFTKRAENMSARTDTDDRNRPDPQQFLADMSASTGISSERLNEIRELMRPQHSDKNS